MAYTKLTVTTESGNNAVTSGGTVARAIRDYILTVPGWSLEDTHVTGTSGYQTDFWVLKSAAASNTVGTDWRCFINADAATNNTQVGISSPFTGYFGLMLAENYDPATNQYSRHAPQTVNGSTRSALATTFTASETGTALPNGGTNSGGNAFTPEWTGMHVVGTLGGHNFGGGTFSQNTTVLSPGVTYDVYLNVTPDQIVWSVVRPSDGVVMVMGYIGKMDTLVQPASDDVTSLVITNILTQSTDGYGGAATRQPKSSLMGVPYNFAHRWVHWSAVGSNNIGASPDLYAGSRAYASRLVIQNSAAAKDAVRAPSHGDLRGILRKILALNTAVSVQTGDTMTNNGEGYVYVGQGKWMSTV